jgi:hypothetical protein
MADRLRANGLKSYGGRALAPGEEFVADSKFTAPLVKLGLVTLVQPDVEAEPPLPRVKPYKRKRRSN